MLVHGAGSIQELELPKLLGQKSWVLPPFSNSAMAITQHRFGM
jgi:hypothetical protein